MALDIESTEAARQQVEDFTQRVQAIRQSLHRVVVGQDDTIDLLLTCALTGSHALLVGVPGLAKTLMVKALAAAFDWKFARIQFTPDLMPSDITGYELLGRDGSTRRRRMVFRRGPVFANLVLADEINRAAPKTQSALLEAMAEQHVTVGGADLSAGRAVSGRGDAEPDRAGRDLPAARGAVGSLHDGDPARLSDARAGGRDRAAHHRRAGRLPPAELRSQHVSCSCTSLVRSVPVPPNVAALAVRLCRASRPGDRRALPFVRDYVAWGAGPRGSQNLVLGRESPRSADGPHRADGRRRPGSRRADPAASTGAQSSGCRRQHRPRARDSPVARRGSAMSTHARQPISRSAGAGLDRAHALQHSASARRAPTSGGMPRARKAARANSSIIANIQPARTCAGSIGKCSPAAAGLMSGCIRTKPTLRSHAGDRRHRLDALRSQGPRRPWLEARICPVPGLGAGLCHSARARPGRLSRIGRRAARVLAARRHPHAPGPRLPDDRAA